MDPGPLGRGAKAGIIDAAAHGTEVVRSHWRDIDALREAAAVLLSETRAAGQMDAL